MYLYKIKKRSSPFFLFPFTLLLTLLLYSPWVSAEEQNQPKPQAWQMNGIVAALDDGHDKIKGYAFDQFVKYDLKDLKSLVKKPEDIAQKADQILKDEKVDNSIRSSAAVALGNLGQAAAPYVSDIVNILKDGKVNFSVRGSVAVALSNLGQ